MASSYTTNYNLDKYVGTDKPNLRDQYNAAMDKIDTALLAANTNATEAKAATLSFQGDLDAVSEAISAETTARQNADTALSGDITANATAISNEITARQNADTALAEDISDNETAISNNATAISNNATAISNETTARQSADTALSNRLIIVESNYFAVIGDSFSDQSTDWPNIVASKTGLRLINLAYGGAGFAPAADTSIPTFVQQLNSLKNNANFNKVKHVIVYGGVNDWSDRNHTSAQTIGYVDAFLASWESISGTKPKITFVFGNVGAPNRNFSRTYYGYPKYVREVCSHIRSCGYSAIEAFPFLMCYTNGDVFNSDLLHPNTNGTHIIASYMTQIIDGTYNGVHNVHVSPFARNNLSGNARVNIDGTCYSISMILKATGTFTLSTGWVQISNAMPSWNFGIATGRTFDELASTLQSYDIDKHVLTLRVANGSLQQFVFGANGLNGQIFLRRSTNSTDIDIASGFGFEDETIRFAGEIV